jgi:hypothetical protein
MSFAEMPTKAPNVNAGRVISNEAKKYSTDKQEIWRCQTTCGE